MNIPAQITDDVKLSWTSCAATDVGHMRRANEDSFLDARENGLWVVADGMGGHSRGDLASQTIIRHLADFMPGDSAEDSIDDLKNRLHAANSACRDKARGDVVGSTVAILLSQGGVCYFIWAGDSRIYRLRDDNMDQITEDHSLVQELFKRGEITAG